MRRGAHGVPSSSEGFCPLERVWRHHADDANRPSCFSRPYIMWVHPSTRRHTGTPTRHPDSSRKLFQVPRWRTRETSGKQSIHTMLTPRKPGRTLRSRWARGARDDIPRPMSVSVGGSSLTQWPCVCAVNPLSRGVYCGLWMLNTPTLTEYTPIYATTAL